MKKLDAQKKRIETGVVSFDDDWPGIFIRGDDALKYSNYLCDLLRKTDADSFTTVLVKGQLRVLQGLLQECEIKKEEKQ